ncbi:helix-turn-helix transcriptional regulator [Arcobacter sp. YIC-310]|uniref:helix-turn-helix transcriptional regulator n=1 Tax=Arcobacter sp. YIC-310 TaxID=3376632 RepID=UPI003C21E9EF
MKLKIPETQSFSYLNYIQKEPQHKNEVLLESNVLILVLKGTKILHLNDKDMYVDENQFLFLKSGTYVMSEVLDEYYEAMLFFYEDSTLLDFISKYNIFFKDENLKETDILSFEKTQELSIVMNSTCNYVKTLKTTNKEIIKLKLEEAFLNILNSKYSNEFKSFLYSIYKDNYFKSFIENNFSYEDNILDLSYLLKMSDISFRQKFKEVYKTTPKKWQTKKRLQKAKILLENSDKNVSEVCKECGFDNLSWFIQVFKKEYNLTPKQIKNNKN